MSCVVTYNKFFMSVRGNNLLSGLTISLYESVGRRENLMFISGSIIDVRKFTS